MAVDVAVLLILGIVIVFFLCRGGGLKAGHAVVCAVFTASVAGLLSGLRQ